MLTLHRRDQRGQTRDSACLAGSQMCAAICMLLLSCSVILAHARIQCLFFAKKGRQQKPWIPDQVGDDRKKHGDQKQISSTSSFPKFFVLVEAFRVLAASAIGCTPDLSMMNSISPYPVGRQMLSLRSWQSLSTQSASWRSTITIGKRQLSVEISQIENSGSGWMKKALIG